jgi:hypothetical protein
MNESRNHEAGKEEGKMEMQRGVEERFVVNVEEYTAVNPKQHTFKHSLSHPRRVGLCAVQGFIASKIGTFLRHICSRDLERAKRRV